MNKTSVILLVILIALLVAGAFVGGWFARGSRIEVVTRKKTVTKVVTIRDTITQYKPEYITKTIIGKDTLYVRDTILERDSVFVVLPRERRVYSDSNYRAVVTGVRPELEEISVYPKTQIVTTTITNTIEKPAPLVSLTLQGGVGGQYDLIHKNWGFGPYVGGGISIRIARKR